MLRSISLPKLCDVNAIAKIGAEAVRRLGPHFFPIPNVLLQETAERLANRGLTPAQQHACLLSLIQAPNYSGQRAWVDLHHLLDGVQGNDSFKPQHFMTALTADCRTPDSARSLRSSIKHFAEYPRNNRDIRFQINPDILHALETSLTTHHHPIPVNALQQVASFFKINPLSLSIFQGNLSQLPRRAHDDTRAATLYRLYDTISKTHDPRGMEHELGTLGNIIAPADIRRRMHRETQTFREVIEEALACAHVYKRIGWEMPDDFNTSPYFNIGDLELGDPCQNMPPFLTHVLPVQAGKHAIKVWPGTGESRSGIELWLTHTKDNRENRYKNAAAKIGIVFSPEGPTITNLQGGRRYFTPDTPDGQAICNGQNLFTWLTDGVITWAQHEGYSRIRAYGCERNYMIQNQFGLGKFTEADRSRLKQRDSESFEPLGFRQIPELTSIFEKTLVPLHPMATSTHPIATTLNMLLSRVSH